MKKIVHYSRKLLIRGRIIVKPFAANTATGVRPCLHLHLLSTRIISVSDHQSSPHLWDKTSKALNKGHHRGLSLFGYCASLVLLTNEARAQSDYNNEILFQKGQWAVTLTHSTKNGSLWYDADTTNSRGKTLV